MIVILYAIFCINKSNMGSRKVREGRILCQWPRQSERCLPWGEENWMCMARYHLSTSALPLMPPRPPFREENRYLWAPFSICHFSISSEHSTLKNVYELSWEWFTVMTFIKPYSLVPLKIQLKFHSSTESWFWLSQTTNFPATDCLHFSVV